MEALAIREELFLKNPNAHGIDACQSVIELIHLHYELLESTGDLQHCNKELELLERAWKFLAVYKEPISQITKYRKMLNEYAPKFQSCNPIDHAIMEKLRSLEAAVDSSKSLQEKVQRQQELIQTIENLLQKAPQNVPLPTTELASEYSSLSWHHLFDQNPAAAEAAARKGLQLAPDETWIYTNLALALLYQGKWEEAKEIYTHLKDQPYNGATYAKTFLEDLEALEKAGITHPDVEKVRQLLR